MLNHVVDWYVVPGAQPGREINEGAHLRRRRLCGAVTAVRVVFAAEVAYEAYAYVRVIADRVRALAVLRATLLYRPVRENHVVVADVIEPTPVEDTEAPATVYLVYEARVGRRAVGEQR